MQQRLCFRRLLESSKQQKKQWLQSQRTMPSMWNKKLSKAWSQQCSIVRLIRTRAVWWTAFLWPTVSCRTGCYPHWFRFHWVLFYLTNHHACQEQDIIKNCAHILTPRQLAGLKEHEEDVKRLKLYATTVHCVNMIVRKMASKSARERSALARELFGLLSSCYVCRCFLFLVGTHCF